MGADHDKASTAAHAPVGRGWCKTGADVCAHWEQKLVGRLRSVYTLRDVALPESVFGPGHWIRTLDARAGGPPEAGDAQQKPVVLLLHGFGNGLGVWFLCVDALVAATGLRVTCIDLPGFGLSSRPQFPVAGDGSAAEAKFVDAIEAWRKTMQIDSLILCGHSFGGYLAAAFAMRHADRCRHVLLVDPWGLPERDPGMLKNVPLGRRLLINTFSVLTQMVEPVSLLQLTGAHQWFANSRRRMVQNLDTETQEHMIEYLYHCNVHAPASGPRAFAAITGPLAFAKRPLIPRFVAAVAAGSAAAGDELGSKRGEAASGHEILRATTPFSFVYGRDSWITSDSGAHVQRIRSAVGLPPSLTTLETIAGAGHNVHLDQPYSLVEALRRALSGVAGRSAPAYRV